MFAEVKARAKARGSKWNTVKQERPVAAPRRTDARYGNRSTGETHCDSRRVRGLTVDVMRPHNASNAAGGLLSRGGFDERGLQTRYYDRENAAITNSSSRSTRMRAKNINLDVIDVHGKK